MLVLVIGLKRKIDYANNIIKSYIKNPPKDWYTGILADCDILDWGFYQGELKATDNVQGADFEIHLTKAGQVEFDLISMIPEDAVAGIFRKDLFEIINAEETPVYLNEHSYIMLSK